VRLGTEFPQIRRFSAKPRPFIVRPIPSSVTPITVKITVRNGVLACIETKRPDERTRTAYPCSLRVIHQALQRCAGACKSGIYRRLSLLWFAACGTVLRSRWCQSGVNHVTGSIPDVPALARRNLIPTTLSRWPSSWRTCSRRPPSPPTKWPRSRETHLLYAPPIPSELAPGYRQVSRRRRISLGSCYSRRRTTSLSLSPYLPVPKCPIRRSSPPSESRTGSLGVLGPPPLLLCGSSEVRPSALGAADPCRTIGSVLRGREVDLDVVGAILVVVAHPLWQSEIPQQIEHLAVLGEDDRREGSDIPL
jgi:hypothetical protein